MFKSLILLIVVSACTTSEPAPPFPWPEGTKIAIVVETGAPLESARAFTERMQADMELWNDALVARGCSAPFHYVTNPQEASARIRLLNKDQWIYPGAIGVTTESEIHILAEGDGTLDTYIHDPAWIVGVHELGHTLGLGHNSYADSVMQEHGSPSAAPIVERDVLEAMTWICN